MRDSWEDDSEFENKGVNAFRNKAQTRREGVARSGFMTALGLLVLIAVLSGIWIAHVHGRIHKLTTTEAPENSAAPVVRPGGQDVVHLERMEHVGIMVPEFASMTLLPGDGMLVLQVMLNLPNGSQVSLLLGTSEANLPQTEGKEEGSPFQVTAESRSGSHWVDPAELIARQPSTRETNEVLPDGNRAIAHFLFDFTSPSAKSSLGTFDTAVTAVMTGRALDLTLSTKNTGNTPRALVLSWQPRFLAPQSGLRALSIVPPVQQDQRIPGAGRSESARLVLGERDVDTTYTGLKHSYLSAGPEVRLRNDADGYTVHMTAMTPNVRSLHIAAAKGGNSVLVAFSTAAGTGEDARTIVQPGETLQWRVRLEATPNAASTPSM